ncbi:MAG: PKD domain-containing protein, partial [Sediminibacterium sp.]
PGNQESIRHIFNQPGTYPVILYIKTKKGCESKFAANVVIPPIQCRFETKIAVGRYNALSYKFNSTHSNLSSSDNIVKRSWSFGDGTYNEGNEANPLKTYAKAGKYKVCLVAKSLKGCRSESCIEIEIKDSTVLPADCFAFFNYEIDNNVVKLNSSRSRSSNNGLSSAPDTIISRTWYFGNNARGIEVPGNQWDMKYAYDQPGTYTITLVIKTRQGCESKYTTTIIIRPADCRFETRIGVGRQSGLSYQFRAEHAGLIAGDSIVKRSWNFGDGTFNEGNDERPVKTYTKAGKYKVCLVAKSRRGCVSESCFEINVSDSSIAPYNCKALFEYSINGTVVYFNSSASTGAPTIGGTNDSIISRTWYLGNATSGPTYGGNEVEVKFDYLKPGTYTAYLVIKTRSGCESKYAVTFTIQPICKAVADFKFEQTAPNKIQFASGASTTTSGDTITQRIWSFGDNTLMTGNVVNPEKVYRTAGTYRVCLQVKTSKGCVADVCKDVRVLDTTNTPGTAINYLKIVSINPNPVQTKMAVTVWSRLPNISTEFTVYDVNGNPKMSFKKELASGNNILEISADRLNPGLYFLRVGNAYGRDSAQFYKQ